jgi:hypothetical protein
MSEVVLVYQKRTRLLRNTSLFEEVAGCDARGTGSIAVPRLTSRRRRRRRQHHHRDGYKGT